MTTAIAESSMHEPSIADVLDALRGFGNAYHDLHLMMQIDAAAGRNDRQEILLRIDRVFRDLEQIAKKSERQFDQVWREVDALKADLESRPPLDEVARLIAQIAQNAADLRRIAARLGLDDEIGG